MDRFVIEGGKRLEGEIEVYGAKNAILPMMAGSILAKGKTIIHNVPDISDVSIFLGILEHLGADCIYDKETKKLELDTTNINKTDVPYELVCQIRASFLVSAPLLARLGRAKISFPGGCSLGTRNIDFHIKGFKMFSADVNGEGGYIILRADRLRGADIYLDYPTHTGTENIMMAGVLAEGKTIIENCAMEPEIVDFAKFLRKMGAKIGGEGTGTITIDGVDSLKPCEYWPIPDRIETGTFIMAGAIANGGVFVKNAIYEHLKGPIAKLRDMGISIEKKDSGILVVGQDRLTSTNVITGPYPSFSTDFQPLICSLMSIAKGTSIVKETVFDNRIAHTYELLRMGANVKIVGEQTIIIEGVKGLHGANVMAGDIRCGAGLVLAGLSAKGRTIVDRVYHIDRGYERLEERLSLLGANIWREK